MEMAVLGATSATTAGSPKASDATLGTISSGKGAPALSVADILAEDGCVSASDARPAGRGKTKNESQHGTISTQMLGMVDLNDLVIAR